MALGVIVQNIDGNINNIRNKSIPKPIIGTITTPTSTANIWQYARYNQVVDLSNVKRIVFRYTLYSYFREWSDDEGDYYACANLQCGVSPNNSGGFTNYSHRDNVWYGTKRVGSGTTFSTSGQLTLDVSAFKGKYYVGIGSQYDMGVHQNSSTGHTWASLTSVEFYKE